MDDNEDLSAEEGFDERPSTDYASKKRLILILMLACSAGLGAFMCFFPEDDRLLDFFATLPLLALGISWCFTDAAERGHRIDGSMKLLLLLLFGIGLLAYLLETRGSGVVKSLGWLLLLVTAMFFCFAVTMVAILTFGDVLGLEQSPY